MEKCKVKIYKFCSKYKCKMVTDHTGSSVKLSVTIKFTCTVSITQYRLLQQTMETLKVLNMRP
jgi:hypothetical protein